MFDAWKQRQRKRLENRPERTVFYNIFATMMLVLAVELLMAAASILAVNVTGQLDENAKDLLTMRVRNRSSYVQEILRNAEDLEQLSEQITATTQQLLKSGDISLDTLDNSMRALALALGGDGAGIDHADVAGRAERHDRKAGRPKPLLHRLRFVRVDAAAERIKGYAPREDRPLPRNGRGGGRRFGAGMQFYVTAFQAFPLPF